jgi:hypothetical protein
MPLAQQPSLDEEGKSGAVRQPWTSEVSARAARFLRGAPTRDAAAARPRCATGRGGS